MLNWRVTNILFKLKKKSVAILSQVKMYTDHCKQFQVISSEERVDLTDLLPQWRLER